MTPRITLAAVARETGFSLMTVSRALSGKGRISNDTKRRIREAAQRLGYRPDPALAALVAHRTATRVGEMREFRGDVLGWITCADSESLARWPTLDVFRLPFEGATAAAATLGYQLQPFYIGRTPADHRRWSRILSARGVRGLLFAPEPAPEGVHLDWGEFASVLVGHGPRGTGLDAVRHDVFQMTLLAIRNLTSLGYRRIGVLATDPGDGRSEFRAIGAAHAACHALPEPRATVLSTVLGSDLGQLNRWVKANQLDALVGLKGAGAVTAALGVSRRGTRPLYVQLNAPAPLTTPTIWIDNFELGRVAVRRAHSLLLANATGVPARRLILRMDGDWHPGVAATA